MRLICYETEKRRLRQQTLSPEEYQQAVKELASKWRV